MMLMKLKYAAMGKRERAALEKKVIQSYFREGEKTGDIYLLVPEMTQGQIGSVIFKYKKSHPRMLAKRKRVIAEKKGVVAKPKKKKAKKVENVKVFKEGKSVKFKEAKPPSESKVRRFSPFNMTKIKEKMLASAMKKWKEGERRVVFVDCKKGSSLLECLKLNHQIIMSDPALYKPLRYRSHDPLKVMIELLGKSNEKNDYAKATLEWRPWRNRPSLSGICTCNHHPIAWDYVIKNTKNDNTMYLGSSCILEYMAFDRKSITNLHKQLGIGIDESYMDILVKRGEAWKEEEEHAPQRFKFEEFLKRYNLTREEFLRRFDNFVLDYKEFGFIMGNYYTLFKEGIAYYKQHQHLTNKSFELWKKYEMSDKMKRPKWEKELAKMKDVLLWNSPLSYSSIFGKKKVKIPYTDFDMKVYMFILNHLHHDIWFKGKSKDLIYRNVYGTAHSPRMSYFYNDSDMKKATDFFTMLWIYNRSRDTGKGGKAGYWPRLVVSGFIDVKPLRLGDVECKWCKSQKKPSSEYKLMAQKEVTDDQGNVIRYIIGKQAGKPKMRTVALDYMYDGSILPTEILDRMEKENRPPMSFPSIKKHYKYYVDKLTEAMKNVSVPYGRFDKTNLEEIRVKTFNKLRGVDLVIKNPDLKYFEMTQNRYGLLSAYVEKGDDKRDFRVTKGYFEKFDLYEELIRIAIKNCDVWIPKKPISMPTPSPAKPKIAIGRRVILPLLAYELEEYGEKIRSMVYGKNDNELTTRGVDVRTQCYAFAVKGDGKPWGRDRTWDEFNRLKEMVKSVRQNPDVKLMFPGIKGFVHNSRQWSWVWVYSLDGERPQF